MKRKHWIGVGILFLVVLWGIFDPPGIGHALTGFFQGVDNFAASIKSGKT